MGSTESSNKEPRFNLERHASSDLPPSARFHLLNVPDISKVPMESYMKDLSL